MNVLGAEDIRDIALKIEKIREEYSENYFYIKGCIHCFWQKKEKLNRQPRRPPQ